MDKAWAWFFGGPRPTPTYGNRQRSTSLYARLKRWSKRRDYSKGVCFYAGKVAAKNIEVDEHYVSTSNYGNYRYYTHHVECPGCGRWVHLSRVGWRFSRHNRETRHG